jgi:hypothetical protein
MMVRLSGNGQTPSDRIVLSVCDFSSYPNSYVVPDDESPTVGQQLTKKQFDKLSGWLALQNSDKTSARLIEDLYDYIATGTSSAALSNWVTAKKAARELFNTNKSRT